MEVMERSGSGESNLGPQRYEHPSESILHRSSATGYGLKVQDQNMEQMERSALPFLSIENTRRDQNTNVRRNHLPFLP